MGGEGAPEVRGEHGEGRGGDELREEPRPQVGVVVPQDHGVVPHVDHDLQGPPRLGCPRGAVRVLPRVARVQDEVGLGQDRPQRREPVGVGVEVVLERDRDLPAPRRERQNQNEK